MITLKGQEIIGKYLLGQTQDYATHMAIGCGANPSNISDQLITLQPTQREVVAGVGSTSNVTLTFSTHSFNVGDVVVVENLGPFFDGQHQIASKTSTTITYVVQKAFPSVATVDYAAPITSYTTVTTNVAHNFLVGDFVTFTGITYLTTAPGYYIHQVIDDYNFVVYDTSTTETGTEVGTIDFSGNYVNYGAVTKIIETDESLKRSLTFEMNRFPISVRGVQVINNQQHLVFGAEIPSIERYGITEIGIFSNLSNPITYDSADSKMISLFTEAEDWQIHTPNPGSTEDVVVFTDAISAGVNNDLSPALIGQDAVFIQASNSLFLDEKRMIALEQPRMFDSTLVVSGALTPGGSTGIDQANVSVIPGDTVKHIHLSTKTNLFDFSKNYVGANSDLDGDEIRVAFSILKANTTTTGNPTTVSIKIVFTNENAESPKSAMLSIQNSDLSGFNERYYVISKKLGDFVQDNGFSWTAVDTIKIFAYIDGSTNYMLALDGMRFENVFDETISPLYGMVAYSSVGANVIPTGSTTPVTFPIIKTENSKNMIEYAIPLQIQRNGFAVQGG
jgi:hypothetical protein